VGEILVIRHGETDYNAEGRLQGTLETELNSNGLRQAVEAAEQLKYAGISVIFSSPMIRARKTAEIIGKELDVPVVFRDALKEKCFGVGQGLLVREIQDRYGDILWEARRSLDHALPEGESNQDVIQRLDPVLREIRQNYQGKRVLVVTHGAVARVLFRMLANPTDQQFESFQMNNCEVLNFRPDSDGYYICEYSTQDTEKNYTE